MSSRLSPLETLDPVYKYLPYCLVIHEEGEGKNKTKEYQYVKTYPAYPWKRGTGSHIEEDNEAFIDACAAAGLVKWETAEEQRERLKREERYSDKQIRYEEWKAKQRELKENASVSAEKAPVEGETLTGEDSITELNMLALAENYISEKTSYEMYCGIRWWMRENEQGKTQIGRTVDEIIEAFKEYRGEN